MLYQMIYLVAVNASLMQPAMLRSAVTLLHYEYRDEKYRRRSSRVKALIPETSAHNCLRHNLSLPNWMPLVGDL